MRLIISIGTICDSFWKAMCSLPKLFSAIRQRSSSMDAMIINVLTLILNKATPWMFKHPLFAIVSQSAHIAFADWLFQSNTEKLALYGGIRISRFALFYNMRVFGILSLENYISSPGKFLN